MADALTVLAYSGAARGSDTKPQAMAAAKRSITLNPGSAPGHTALACAVLLYENSRAMARQEFERALELSPNYEMGRCWYANFYLNWARGDYEPGHRGSPPRAREQSALRVHHDEPRGLSVHSRPAGSGDRSVPVGHSDGPRVVRGAVGARHRTRTRPDDSKRQSPHSRLLRRCRGAARSPSLLWLECSGRGRQPAEALALHRELVDRASRGYVSAAHLALTAEAAGQHEEAMAFARRAWDEREPAFILWARHFPQYRTLHSDPRFAAILREMDSP